MTLLVFVFSFIAKTASFYRYKITYTLLMRSHFEKYVFLHHFLVFTKLYPYSICKNIMLLLVRNCWDIKSDILSTSPNDVIGIHGVIAL